MLSMFYAGVRFPLGYFGEGCQGEGEILNVLHALAELLMAPLNRKLL